MLLVATGSLIDLSKSQDLRKKIMVDIHYESLCPGKIFDFVRDYIYANLSYLFLKKIPETSS